MSRQILARIIGYERFRSWWHKFDVDRISGGFSISGGGEGGEEEPAMSEQISSAISRIWVKTPALSNREKEEEDEEKGCARPRIERIERVETRLTRKYIIKTRENRVFSTRGFRQRGQSGRGKNKGEQLFKCYRAKNTRRGGMIIRLFRVGGGKIER